MITKSNYITNNQCFITIIIIGQLVDWAVVCVVRDNRLLRD